ncbi:hypothetical protein B0H11DRAFT_1917538 [Mycena galericulata]|nr:hypothetical protein B0H11DRAFT_1917538 [Mycena galericulata]
MTGDVGAVEAGTMPRDDAESGSIFPAAHAYVAPGRNARFIIISGTPGCLRVGKFSAECEAGLAALDDVDDADEAGGLTGSFASKILDLCCDGVEITLHFSGICWQINLLTAPMPSGAFQNGLQELQ